MYTNPILVRKIKHLTDARYFAAMGIDWMSMVLDDDPKSFLFWHTLRDWVEGVKMAAEINSEDEMLFAKTVIDAKPDGLILTQVPDHDAQPQLPLFFVVDSASKIELSSEDAFILLFTAELMLSMDLILGMPKNKIFLQADWSFELLSSVLSKGYTGGICFMGGDEDKIGLRDFTEMDELIELLLLSDD